LDPHKKRLTTEDTFYWTDRIAHTCHADSLHYGTQTDFLYNIYINFVLRKPNTTCSKSRLTWSFMPEASHVVVIFTACLSHTECLRGVMKPTLVRNSAARFSLQHAFRVVRTPH